MFAACSTIFDLLAARAGTSPDDEAVLAPGRAPLTYGGLYGQAQGVVARLRNWGIGRNDRVAVVLPDGPEMAVAFLSIASGATFAPLNPAYRAGEYEFYLSDLKPKVLILAEADGADSPAAGVAQALGIPLVRLAALANGPAGLFTLAGGQGQASALDGPAEPDDVALVLHTSGTTGRPKIVPLTHRNLCTSAGNIIRTLQLTQHDRSLSVMPMFHMHPLPSAILSSLAVGGSVVCTPGFYAPYFFEWLEMFRPTWYTAAPAIHQAVLVRAMENPQAAARSSLRFIRAASAPLPERVRVGLERAFGVPMIEYYGMTEAAQQITSNPLPPGLRKPGSVGPAAGPEVAIMAEDGDALLPAGEIGEVVIRGPNVISGYANNLEANARSFVNGWLRTGDQGYTDVDGYFYITGRLKELINRGGEKISPREVDDVLLEHPAVAEAVTFAMPDEALGEDVAAAVVLRDPSVTEQELRRFVSRRLADFKVPRRIMIVEDLPKTVVGKVQRGGLAEKLGLPAGSRGAAPEPRPSGAPRSAVEETLAKIWGEVLNVPAVGVHQGFLDLGGDSILAAQLLARVRQVWNVEVSVLDLFEAPTIAGLAGYIEQAASTAGRLQASVPGTSGEREELEV